MTCTEFQELLAPYVDGALSTEEASAARVHLQACARCAQLAGQAERFREALRGRLATVRAPEAARARILAGLGSRRATARSWSRPLLVGAVAALLVLSALSLFRRDDTVLASIATDVLAAENDRVALDLRTRDPAELAAFFSRALGVKRAVAVTDLRERGWTLVGGAIVRVGGVRGTLTVYRRGKKVVLCHRFPLSGQGKAGLENGGFYSFDGVTVYVEKHAGELCCLASRMPRRAFVREVLGRRYPT